MLLLVVLDLLAGLLAVQLAGLPSANALVLLGLGVLALVVAGQYHLKLALSSLDDLPGLLGAMLVTGFLALTGWFLLGFHIDAGLVKRLIVTVVVWPVVAAVLRAVDYEVVRATRLHRSAGRRTLIVGSGVVATRVAQILVKHREYGLHVVGFVDAEASRQVPPDVPPVLGSLDDLVRVIVAKDVQRVVIAFTTVRESQMVEVIRKCDRLDCEIYVVPRLFELYQGMATDHVWGIPVTRLPRPAFRSPLVHLKRAVDVLLSGAALLALGPLILVCSLAARLETGGWFFVQERIGLGGRPFRVLKIQTMKPADDAEAATNWNIGQDHRLGRTGRLLRRTSLDELPQLWNVFRGDMSLVGPRPERPHFVEQFSSTLPHYPARTRVPAGLTGWAQVHDLRGDTSVEDRATFDNYYIEHWSLWGDVKILLRTVSAVVRGAGS